MKHQKQLLAVLLMGVACTLQAQRSETLLEKNWKFSKGDFKEASQPEFNDTKWESVVIPHDWAIFGPFDMNNSYVCLFLISQGEFCFSPLTFHSLSLFYYFFSYFCLIKLSFCTVLALSLLSKGRTTPTFKHNSRILP